jgi:hypothetical protein
MMIAFNLVLRAILLACVLLAAALLRPAYAAATFVPASSCGIREGTRIVRVTSTDAAAPGGLLAALAVPGPKIVIFQVGGVIALRDDVEVTTPFTTIAGETAPHPGITLTGASLRIRAHDICIRHVSVRPGAADTPEVGNRRDGIAIGGNPRKYGGPIERVVLENVSVSWGVDENVSVWYAGTNTVQIRSALIAEGLRKAGHPKGSHSMGMVVASDVTKVSVSSTIFAHNNDRHPRISPNAQVSIEENLVYNSGNMSTEVYLNCQGPQHDIAMIRNLYIPGQDTRRGRPQYVFVDAQTRRPIAAPEECPSGFDKVRLVTADETEAKRIYEERLKHSGSRPFARNAEDARIINDIQERTGRIRDTAAPLAPSEAPPPPRAGGFVMPAEPFATEANGQFAIVNALCRAHLKLGGLPYRGCSAEKPRERESRRRDGR